MMDKGMDLKKDLSDLAETFTGCVDKQCKTQVKFWVGSGLSIKCYGRHFFLLR